MSTEDDFRKLAKELAKDKMRKEFKSKFLDDDDEGDEKQSVLSQVLFGPDEEKEPEAGPIKKLAAAGLGALAILYLVNSFVPIIPLLNQLHYLFALGIVYWSVTVFGYSPFKALTKWRKKRALAKEEKLKLKAKN